MTTRPFEQIVAEHGAVVLRVCRALLDPIDADDAWSETFISAMRAYPDLRPGSNVRGWLVTIAHNRAIDLLRSKQRRPRPTSDLPEQAVHDQADHDQRIANDDELRVALEALAPKQRGAVVLRYLADLSYADVGAALGCSETAARRNAADGISRLRSAYPHYEPTRTT